MRIRVVAFIAFIAFAALAGATTGAQLREALVVSSTWLAQHLGDPNLVLLHLGDRAEYDAGHIPGARFLTLTEIAISDRTGTGDGLTLQVPPADDLRARLEALGISDDSRIVVSYGKDRMSSATRVLFTLDYAGLGERSSLLDGGFVGWARGGQPTTAEAPAARSGKLSPLKTRPLVVDADHVLKNLKTTGVSIVDGRLPAFYSGAQTGGSAQAPHQTGHIPGALNVPFSLLANAESGLKTDDELKALFAEAGVKPGDTVVAYCHIGQQATVAIFAARTLGYRVLLYDGSFEDWSKRPGFPVENPSKK